MIALTEQLFTLKALIRMYENAIEHKKVIVAMELSVDIAEAAELLEQISIDYANG